MNRTFHQKLSIESLLSIILMGGIALFCFWQRNTAMAFIGTLVMAADVVAIERMIHTTYTFSDDQLTVSRGRFAKTVTVAVSDIVKAECLSTALRTSHYVLLQIGANRHLSLQPDNVSAFLEELRKRQRRYDIEQQ